MNPQGASRYAAIGLVLGILTLWGCEPRVVIVTGTTVGLEASPGDGSTQPPSVTFGYKRAEVAFVPTGQEKGATKMPDAEPGKKPSAGTPEAPKEDSDAYSTLAVFRLAHNWFSATKIEQLVATGHAAREIQKKGSVFSRSLSLLSAGTDDLSKKFTVLLGHEPEGDCWKAIQDWRAKNLKEVDDFDFAVYERYKDERSKSWKDATVASKCQGR